MKDEGVLVFNRSDVLVFGGDITGSGAVVQAGNGRTILTGTNSYTGGTIISAGTLQFGDEGGEQRGWRMTDGRASRTATLKATADQTDEAIDRLSIGAVVNNGALQFNRSDALLASDISGTGSVTQAGTGTLTLRGTNGYAGGTFVKSGTLVLDGSLSSAVSVEAGAVFAGVGSIDGSVAVSGSIAPGLPEMPFGALRAEGNLQLSPGGRYVVAIDAEGNHTQLVTGGAAAFTDATVAVQPSMGSYGRVSFYPVLYAEGGLVGTPVVTISEPRLEPWLVATPTALALTVLNTEVPLASYAATPSGAAVGAALDRLRRQATGDLALVTRELAALDDGALSRGLEAIAGEVHASIRQLAALDGEAVMDLVREETASVASIDDGLPISASWMARPGRRTWARFQALRSSFGDGSAQAADADLSVWALATQWAREDGWLAGVGAGYTKGNVALKGLTESSTYRSPRGFGYVGYASRRSAVRIGASVARSVYDVRRRLVFIALLPEGFGSQPLFGGVQREATSAPTELASDVWSDWSIMGRVGSWSVGPSVGLRYARYSRRSWTENGAGSLSLSAPGLAAESAQGDFGVRAARALGRFQPNASVGYRRELTGDRAAVMVQLSDHSGGSFVVDGAGFTRNSVTTRAGLMVPTGDLGLSVLYEARHAHGENATIGPVRRRVLRKIHVVRRASP